MTETLEQEVNTLVYRYCNIHYQKEAFEMSNKIIRDFREQIKALQLQTIQEPIRTIILEMIGKQK